MILAQVLFPYEIFSCPDIAFLSVAAGFFADRS
jgi:hypothetical protein